MGTIFVDNLEPQSGTSLTLGASGDTISTASGALQSNFLYPAFEAYMGSDQTISNNAYTKANVNTELFDTDGKYDTSTYRFTPTIAGKYFVYGSLRFETEASQLLLNSIAIYKNGSIYSERTIDPRNNQGLQFSVDVSTTVVMDSDDYLELYGKIYYGGGSTIKIAAAVSVKSSNFGAYRIGT